MGRLKKATPIISAILLLVVIILVHPREVLGDVARIGWTTIGVAGLLLLGNMFLGAFRFSRLLHMNGANLGLKFSLRAYMVGNVGSLFVLSLLGQAGARQVMLRKAGVDPALNTSIIVVERFATAALSGGLAVLSGIYLLGFAEIEDWVQTARIIPMLLAMGLSIIFAIWVFGSKRFRSNSLLLLNAKLLIQSLEVLLITFLQMVCMISSFAIVALALAPEAGFLNVLCVSSLVSFCASLPISVGGWGVREVAAVAFFGRIGFPPSEALAVTISTGILWLGLTIGSAYLVFLLVKENIPTSGVGSSGPLNKGIGNPASAMLMVVPYMGAVAIFYQFYVTLPQGPISVNFADPFALLSLMMVVSESVRHKVLPEWRMKSLNLVFGLITLMMLWGIVVAFCRTGVVSQVFVSRGLGWIVLLGYVSMGGLFIRSLGNRGFGRATVLLSAAACAVIFVEVSHRWLFILGATSFPPTPNFEGFSGNRNAFTFAILLIMCAIFANSRRLLRVSTKSNDLWIGALVVLSTAVLLTGSRTGIITLIVLLVTVGVMRILRVPKIVGMSLCIIGFWWVVTMSPQGVAYARIYIPASVETVFGSLGLIEVDSLEFNRRKERRMEALRNTLETSRIQSPLSGEGSDFERGELNRVAWNLFLETPWLGQGLGAFFEKSLGLLGTQYVIHNTWLWILVEFGLIGFAMAAMALALFAIYIIKGRLWGGNSRDLALIMGLICFGLFSLMHEMSFQRIVWFGLGIVMVAGHNQIAKRVTSIKLNVGDDGSEVPEASSPAEITGAGRMP